MARVTLEVPRILRDCTDGRSPVDLEADRLDAIRGVVGERWPVLATHVWAEGGELRPHVLLLHNDRLTRGTDPREIPLADGDRLAIVQAVSGG